MAEDRPKFGRTALWWAAEKGHTEIAKMLITAGANVNIVTEVARLAYALFSSSNQENSTPLHVACAGQHHDVVLCLIDHGADVTITNEVMTVVR